MASIPINLESSDPEPYVTPAEIYCESNSVAGDLPSVELRIATGGAGQSGILKALCEAFIRYECSINNAQKSFSVAWLMSDTSASFNYLASRAADLSITYHHAAEAIAIKQGIANRREYAWRDHWLLVGQSFSLEPIYLNLWNTIFHF